jgi:hypothetical protein
MILKRTKNSYVHNGIVINYYQLHIVHHIQIIIIHKLNKVILILLQFYVIYKKKETYCSNNMLDYIMDRMELLLIFMFIKHNKVLMLFLS